jgi:two-component system sensor histidine kinase VanS
LKNKKRNTSDYIALRQKIYIRLTLVVLLASFLVFLVMSIPTGWMRNFLIETMLQGVFNLTGQEALHFYWRFFRRNQDLYVIVIVATFFIVFSRQLLSHFNKYFTEISQGLDVLVEEKGEIKLSSEMEEMELKLKTIKGTLQQRELIAKKAEQRKADLVMYLAHDIKTPLTSVIGYLSLLDENTNMPVEQKAKYVGITLEKAYQLEKLVEEFFEITSYNFHEITLAKEEIDLNYMLTQMADEFYPLLISRSQEVTLSLQENLHIYGDPDKLARVFNNILKNAIAYGEANSKIEIVAKNTDKNLLVQFKNSGSVPKEKLNSMFEKFYRLDDARSSHTGGAGLGLAIAKEIVLLHDGEIAADSDQKQTVFTLTFPIEVAN